MPRLCPSEPTKSAVGAAVAIPKYIKKQTKIVNNICLKILDPFVKKAYYSTLEFNF
jgi:hypothetical protein